MYSESINILANDAGICSVVFLLASDARRSGSHGDVWGFCLVPRLSYLDDGADSLLLFLIIILNLHQRVDGLSRRSSKVISGTHRIIIQKSKEISDFAWQISCLIYSFLDFWGFFWRTFMVGFFFVVGCRAGRGVFLICWKWLPGVSRVCTARCYTHTHAHLNKSSC